MALKNATIVQIKIVKPLIRNKLPKSPFWHAHKIKDEIDQITYKQEP